MIPGKYDMTLYRGGTFDVSLSASDADGPIDFGVTYTSAEMRVYRAWMTNLEENPDNFLFELTTDNGMIVIAGTSIHLGIPASVTQSLTFESGVYLLKLIVDGLDPIVDPFLNGKLKVQNGAV